MRAPALFAVLCIASAPALASKPEPKAKAAIPESARPGARDLSAVVTRFSSAISEQPYGKRWTELVPVAPAPRDRSGIGKAETHPALAHDPIEVQEQVQFIQETGVEARYGFVSIRVVRLFRYGVLTSVRLVFDRIGRSKRSGSTFDADLAAIRDAWRAPATALGLDRSFVVVKNDLADAPGPNTPYYIDLEPLAEKTK